MYACHCSNLPDMNILIIEDEPLSASMLRKLILKVEPDANVLDTVACVECAINWFNENQMPDLIFMDIELSDGQCFDLFEKTNISTPVIFTTAYDQYAVKAFKVNSIDYLLKPIREEELRFSIEKYKKQKLNPLSDTVSQFLKGIETGQKFKNRFLVRSGNKYVIVPIEDVSYFLTEQKVTILVTNNGSKYYVDHPLEDLEEILDPSAFFRANRQSIISVHSIEHIHYHFKGKLKLDLRPRTTEELFVSKEKAAEFKNWLNQ